MSMHAIGLGDAESFPILTMEIQRAGCLRTEGTKDTKDTDAARNLRDLRGYSVSPWLSPPVFIASNSETACFQAFL